MYIMGVAEKDRLCLNRKKHIERESYDGMVYCASVPNGTLITRRNGTMLISGNCWIFGPTKAVEIIRLIQGQPMISLSATSVGAQIKNFREEGGWGQEGLEFIAEHGIIPESLWPECKLRTRKSGSSTAVPNGGNSSREIWTSILAFFSEDFPLLWVLTIGDMKYATRTRYGLTARLPYRSTTHGRHLGETRAGVSAKVPGCLPTMPLPLES
jgi:hypothetical protein